MPVGPLWDSLDGLLRPYVPPHLRDPRLVDPDSPYRTVDRFEALLRDAGAGCGQHHDGRDDRGRR